MVEWEYTLLSLVPRRRKRGMERKIILRNQTHVSVGRGHTKTKTSVGKHQDYLPMKPLTGL